MKLQIKEQFLELFPHLESHWDKLSGMIQHLSIPAKQTLLREGDMADRLYLILKGCMRLYFITIDGRDISAKFFFEGQGVACSESFLGNKPSKMYMETLEQTEAVFIGKENFHKWLMLDQSFKDFFLLILQGRLNYYINLYSSYILDSPETRYLKLVHNDPIILERIPHHYIASYIGISPVHLSRIRSKIHRSQAHMISTD